VDANDSAALPARLRGWRFALIDVRSLVVLALTATLGLGAAAVSHLWLSGQAASTVLTLPWWALALGFAATEACVFHLQTEREARTVSVSELPLVLGLFFAGPAALLLGRLVGSGLVFLLYRRSTPLKTAFNLAMVAAQTAVAVTVFQALGDGSRGVGHPLTWLATWAAPFAANAVGSIALALVFAVFEGSFDPRGVLRDMTVGEPAAPVVTTIALLSVTCLTTSRASVWPLVLAGAGLLLGFRAYASLSDRHLNLERLYRFTQAVSSAPEVDQVIGNVLEEARQVLRSEGAAVVLVGESGGVVAVVRLGVTGQLTRSEGAPNEEDQWLLAHVVSAGSPMLLARGARDPEQRRWLSVAGAREAVAVPLRGSAGVLGALLVTDRLGDVRTFDADDVLLLETVAAHAGVALQNGELIGQLRHEAMHDTLTGLPNRAYLQRRMGATLEEVAAGRADGAAVMILDLDGFKAVNDSLGHHQGDQLLIEVAARLRDAVGADDVVARLGGDEFAVLVTGSGDEDRAVHVGHRLLQVLERPVLLAGVEVAVGGSLGIALAPRHAADVAGLLKQADMAMYKAKASTRGLQVFEPEITAPDPRRLALVAELRSALAAGQIQVHVQPQARLADGRVVSVEALARWVHPQRGNLPPDEFILVAERGGLIGQLTHAVLDASLAAVAAWRRQGHDLSISVNLSTHSLQDADLVGEVSALLHRHGVPGDRLLLEVTEGAVMADPGRAITLLHQLRALGVRLSVDDFGTGYSSLSYLKKLPVQEVKIDRSFIAGLQDGGGDVAIVRAIVDLGRHLGLEVVAEGVEDQASWDLLRAMGCDLVQGWHLARAMPVAELEPWLVGREVADLRVVHAG
jgi:diguanylate cyclase (GGDEF)-like protein